MARGPHSPFRLLRMVCLALLAVAAGCSQVAPGPLERWLQSLVIVVPDQSFQKYGFEIDVVGLRCTGLRLRNITAAYDNATRTVAFDVRDASAACDARWRMALGSQARPGPSGLLHSDGAVHAGLSVSSARGSISLTSSGTPRRPSGAAAGACHLVLEVDTLNFTGKGLVSSLLRILKPVLVGALKTVLPKEVCQQVNAAVDQKLTAAIQQLNNIMEPLLPPAPRPQDPVIPGTVQWHESGTLAQIDAALDRLLGPASPINVGHLVDYFTNGTGVVSIARLNISTPPVGPLLNGTFLSAGLSAVRIAGLSSFLNGHLVRPYGNQSLSAYVDLQQLNVSLQGHVAVHNGGPIVKDGDLREDFRVDACLSNVSLGSIGLAVLNATTFNALDDYQRLHLGCLAPLVLPGGLRFTQLLLGLRLGAIDIRPQEGGLEAQLDEAITQTLTLLTAAYSEVCCRIGPPGPSPIPQVLPLVSNGLLAGPGRRALNALLEHSLAHATTQFHCPAPWPRPRRPVAAAAAPTALLKWLEHLQVVLPPLQYRFLGLHAGVRAWGCSAVHIDGVTSAHRMTSDDGLSLTLVGAGLQCDGEYEYSIAHLVPQRTGRFRVVLNDTALRVALKFRMGDEPRTALSADVLDCQAAVVLQSIKFTGGAEAYVIDALAPLLESLFRRDGGAVLCRYLPGSLGPQLTRLLQGLRRELVGVADLPGPRYEPEPAVPPGLVDWGRVGPVQSLPAVVAALVGPNATQLNRLIARLTNGTGTAALPGLRLRLPPLPVPSLGTVALALTGVAVSGLDTWTDVQPLRPSGEHSVATDVAAAHFGLALRGTADVHLTDGGALRNADLCEEFEVSLAAPAFEFRSDIFLAVKEQAFGALSGSQFVAPGCLLPALEAASLRYLELGMAAPTLNVTVGDGARARPELEHAISDAVQSLIDGYIRLLPAMANASAGRAQALGNVHLPDLIRVAQTFAGPCPSDALQGDGAETARNRRIGHAVIAVFAVCVAVAAMGLGWTERRVARATDPEPDEAAPPPGPMASDCSLVRHPALPWYVRYGLPLAVCVNIILFLSSNTNVGASVGLQVQVGHWAYKVPQGLFDFALGNTVSQMWQARVYPLSLLIAVFSGMWPYVKLVLMLFIWCAPPALFPDAWRETALAVLDRLGKWSLIDAYVLVLMMVAFRFHIATAAPGGPPHNAALDVLVGPDWGFFSFLLATQLSLALSHALLAAYRFTGGCAHSDVFGEYRREGAPDDPDAPEPREALHRHRYRFGGCAVAAAGARWLVPGLLLGACGLLGLGAFIDSFQFHFRGLAGLALGPGAVSSYSLVSLAQTLPSSTQHPNAFGIRWIQTAYLLFALVVPLAQLLILLLLWLAPLTLRRQKQWFVAAEVLNAWSALDVFIVSIIAALLQIRQFAQFIVGGRCDAIDALLRKYLPNALDGDPVCFDVVATIGPSSWVLFTAGLLLFAVTYAVMGVCLLAIRQRSEGLVAAHSHRPPRAEGAGPCGPLTPCRAALVRVLGLCGLVRAEQGHETALLYAPSSDEECA